MMSFIMYVVRSVTCGRAVKTLFLFMCLPSWVSCVSKDPQKLGEEDKKEVEREPVCEGSLIDWLFSLTGKSFLSMG